MAPDVIRDVADDVLIEDHTPYTLASGQSQFSSANDSWIMGSTTQSTGVQRSRVPLVQRSTLTTSPSFDTSGLRYVLAMMLPIFSANSGRPARYTLSTLLNTAELCFGQLTRIYERLKDKIRQFAEGPYARDVFAAAMDIVLLIYAMGFLVLSMYQASVTG